MAFYNLKLLDGHSQDEFLSEISIPCTDPLSCLPQLIFLDISAEDAAAKGDEPLSASEVRFIVQSPELNSARQFGDSIAIAVNDAPLDAALLKGETGFAGRESSVAKQAAIGRAFSLAVEGGPAYKICLLYQSAAAAERA